MPEHIVIAGGGFGGYHVARTLRRLLPLGRARVTLVNDDNFLLYTPFMGAVAGGAVEPRHIVIPLREELKGTDVRILRVEGARPAERTLQVRNQAGKLEDLAYDRLIVSLGSVTRALPVPGLLEHAIGFKTVAEAAGVRDRLIRTLDLAETLEDPEERREHLTFVFVGGGYAGLAGLAETQNFARDLMRIYPRCRAAGMRWLLVEARDRIMGEIPQPLADFAGRELAGRGIEVLSETTAKAITATSVTLSTGEVVPTRFVVWSAGVTPAPVVRELGMPLDRGGRIVVDDQMRVQDTPGVWALGDAAAVPDPARPGEACPPTRQHAMRQAWRLGENVAAELAGERTLPFAYRTRGVFVDLGRNKAVALFFGMRLRGLPAWLLTRFYHLKHVPGPGRKLQLLTDWFADRAFPRDSSELGQVPHRIDQPRAVDAERAGHERFAAA